MCTSIRRVLAARGIPLTDEDIARIDACSDVAQLEQWVDRASTCGNASALFLS